MRLTTWEKQLVERIIQRDERALQELYKTYEKPIRGFIRRQLSDPEKAQEILQEVFYDFIERLRDFRGESSIKTFLFTIARYKVIDIIRKKKIKQILFSSLPSYVVEGLKTVLMDDEIGRRELSEKIQKVFTLLPNDYQMILRLKYIEGSKVSEIAKNMRLSFKATESLLFRARRAFIKVYQSLP